MGVSRLVRVGSPYNGVELEELDFEQSADTMYLAHIDHAPTKLLRSSHTEWEFATISFGPDVAAPTGVSAVATTPNTDVDNGGNAYFPRDASYTVTAIDDESGQESRAAAPDSATNDLTLKRNYNTITWSGSADRYRIYKADLQQNFGYIGTTEGTSFTDDFITPDLSDGPPVGDSPFDGAGDYPSAVAFHEQRLIWARSRNHPNAAWGSKSGDYENMDISRPLKADDALSFAINGGRVNAINQMVSTKTGLLALTSDSVFNITGGAEGDYLTASQIVVRRQIGRGASRLNPIVIDNIVLYKTSVGASIRAIGYSFELDGVKSDDVTIFSPHLFEGFEIVSMAYAQEPRSIIWVVRDDGRLLCFTFEQEQQVAGWTLCETNGSVESVCVISEQGEDRLYLTVRRTVNGVERVFIERMASASWEDIEDTCFLDCAVTYDFDTASDTLNNLHHLEGETLTALADGNVVDDLTVVDGTVTLPFEASKVTIGLPYDALIETLPLAIQTREGWTVARRSTVGEAVVRVVKSRGLLVGPDDDHLDVVRPRQDEAYAAPNALKTGDYAVDVQAVTSDDGARVVVKSDGPLPMTITAVLFDPNLGG